jgi:ATP-binding cassette subfamily E protein 1
MQLIDIVADSLVIYEGSPGIEGFATSPMSKEAGMNRFLKDLSITYRRDESTGRPRVNKEGSRLDRLQKEAGDYYYATNKEAGDVINYVSVALLNNLDQR